MERYVKNTLFEYFEDETGVLILDADVSTIYRLDKTGMIILCQFSVSKTIEEVQNSLQDIFEDLDEQELKDFIQELIAKGIICFSE